MRDKLDGSMSWPMLCNTQSTPRGWDEVRTQICGLGEERREGICFLICGWMPSTAGARRPDGGRRGVGIAKYMIRLSLRDFINT